MEEKKIYFNRQKALVKILIGLVLFGGVLFLVKGFFSFLLVFVAGTFIYYGIKSISKKPQLIISDEGLYLGFSFKKTIAWKKIEKATIKERSINFWKFKFMEVIVKMKSTSPTTVSVKEFPLGNLDTSAHEIEKLIQKKHSENIS